MDAHPRSILRDRGACIIPMEVYELRKTESTKREILLIEVSPYVNGEYGNKENTPTNKGTSATLDGLVVKKEANKNRTNDLSNPVHEVVEGTSLDIEQITIVRVEFYDEPGQL